jgi:hypothetical protein
MNRQSGEAIDEILVGMALTAVTEVEYKGVAVKLFCSRT